MSKIAGGNKLEDILTEGDMKYRALFNSARDGIIFLDNKGAVTDVNEAFVRISGYSEEEIKSGVFPESLCRNKTREMLDEFLGKVIDGKQSKIIECEMIPKAGGSVEMEVEGHAVNNEQGDTVGIWMVFHDVTKQKVTEKLSKAERYLTDHSVGSQNLDETLKAGVQAILEATGLDIGMAGFLTEDGKTFELAYSQGVSDEYVKAAISMVSSDSRFRVIQESGPIYTRYEDLPVFQGGVQNWEKIKSVAIMPIFEDGELIGGVNVGSRTMEEIPYESRYIIESLVNQMGKAISKHRLLLAYKENEELYRALVESSPDSVLLLDLEGKIMMASRAAVEMYGAGGEEEILGKNVIDIVVDEKIDNARKSMAEVAKNSVVRNIELDIINKDGGHMTVEVSGTLIRDINGNPKAVLTTSRDITERKNTEERLKKINAELKGYAHTVSHDLRGPVANIILGTDVVGRIMEDLPDNEELADLREVIDSIGDHAKKTLQLIQDLLDLAEAGQVPFNIVEVDINKTVDRVMAELSQKLEEKKITVEVDEDLGTIQANSTQIYQLFSNLMQNAVKHNNKEDLVVEVRRLSPPGSEVNKYLVRDNGSGIPEGLTSTIFDPFARTGKLKPGIGLSIVDKIVEAYNGEIKYYCQDGACFEIMLPNI